MSGSIQAIVLGATGYVGGELLRLLAAHPEFELAAAVSDRCDGEQIAATFPHLASACVAQHFIAHEHCLSNIDHGAKLALFSAAPHGASAALIARTLAAAEKKNLQVHVVDSSADFRYARQSDYEAVYGGTHGAADLLPQFYSAVPEHAHDVSAPHIGHPGCFATAILLAAVPLLRSGLTDAEIFVSATTGSTGSGRSPQEGTHHPERHSNMYAYKPLAHRHAPEISRLAAQASGRENRVHFVPHSGPFARGIYATVQAKTPQTVTLQQLRDAFSAAYASAPFVQLVDATPRLKNVVASNYCHIGLAAGDDAVVVMSAIDNLVKGAAGGAVQWMNRLWQLPETSGLMTAAPGWI
ncbi:MAG: N-acetyl-gamma-glutamyl-phosphate reductase [Gammaproteobacteria bacterium]|nr:N-acetyl-gamma-glutamyl-phosphate reductase [Gammaproteobacteria bacterium]MDH5303150.1 N-acetyl-gamma-glutamyl-phosphate reductase [Gammaproteobacteria bacterium]MDH5320842.1 N-acetyl-gamma-glutamyl-phosphate reductase [Gammaproteobacteria bacterium]